MPTPPVSGRQWCGDDISWTHHLTTNRREGITISNSGGGVAPSIVTDPIGAARQCLRTRAVGSGAASETVLTIGAVVTDTPANTPIVSIGYSGGGVWIRARMALDWAAAGTNNICCLRFLDSSGAELARVHFTSSGKARTIITTGTVTATATNASITENTFFNLTVFYRPSSGATNGSIRLWVNDVEQTEVAQTHNTTTAVGKFGLACIKYSAGGETNNVYVYSHALYDGNTVTEFGYTPATLDDGNDGTYGEIGEEHGGSITFRVGIKPEVYKATWSGVADLVCKIRYHAGTVWSDGSAIDGPVIALASAYNYFACGQLDSLAAGDYVWERRYYRTSATSDILVGAERGSFRIQNITLPRVIQMGFVHCEDSERGRPHKHYKYLYDLGVDGLIHLGDDGYNDAGGGGIQTTSTCPSAQTYSWCKDQVGKSEDRYRRQFKRNKPTVYRPDDHDKWENDCSAGYRKSSSNATINPGGADGASYKTHTIVTVATTGGAGTDAIAVAGDLRGYFSAGRKVKIAGHGTIDGNWTISVVQYSAPNTNIVFVENLPSSTTAAGTAQLICDDPTMAAANVLVSTLVDQNGPAWKTHYGDLILNAAYPSSTWYEDETFASWSTAKTQFVALDTRTFQDEKATQPTSGGVATMLGAGQKAWLLALIAACTKPTLIIYSQAAWSDRVGGTDNYVSRAPAEREEILTAIQNNPYIKSFFVFGGDRHYTLIDRPFVAGRGSLSSGFTFTKKYLCIQVGPGVKGTMPAFDPSWATESDVLIATVQGVDDSVADVLRMFGVFTLNESAGTMKIDVRSGDTNALVYSVTVSWGKGPRNRIIQQPTRRVQSRAVRGA